MSISSSLLIMLAKRLYSYWFFCLLLLSYLLLFIFNIPLIFTHLYDLPIFHNSFFYLHVYIRDHFPSSWEELPLVFYCGSDYSDIPICLEISLFCLYFWCVCLLGVHLLLNSLSTLKMSFLVFWLPSFMLRSHLSDLVLLLWCDVSFYYGCF